MTAMKRVMDDEKGGRQVMAAAMKRAMAMVRRAVCDKEGNGNGGKSNGKGNKVGGQATASMAMATATATCGQW